MRAAGFKIIVRLIAESHLIDSDLNGWLANCYAVKGRYFSRLINRRECAIETVSMRSGGWQDAYFLSAHDGGTRGFVSGRANGVICEQT